jgi:hypothetical protein
MWIKSKSIIINKSKIKNILANFFFNLIFKDLNAYEIQLRNLEEERDRFRRELHKYKRSSKEKVKINLKKIF